MNQRERKTRCGFLSKKKSDGSMIGKGERRGESDDDDDDDDDDERHTLFGCLALRMYKQQRTHKKNFAIFHLRYRITS